MFAIVVNEKGGEQKRLEFDKPEVTIGRVQGNDIILPKGNVSKRHSRIVLKDGKFIIVDLKSTNGTYVNGRKITSPLVVKGSDKIYIGDFILSIEELQGAAVADDGAPPPPRVTKSPTIPPPPPRRNTTGDYAAEAGGAASDEEARPDEETPPPPEPPARPVRTTMPSGPSGPAASPPARMAPAPAAPPRSPSRIDMPTSRPAPAPVAAAPAAMPSSNRPPSQVQPIARPTPAAVPASRPAPAAVAPARRPAPAPAPAPVDDGKRAKLTEVMRELATRLSAALGVDTGNVDATQEEDLWTRAESAAADLVDQLSADGAIPAGVDTNTLLKDVVAETLGTGPLDEWLGDEGVREISIARHDRVYVDRGNGQLQLANKWFSSPEALTRVVERVIARAGRQADLHAARSGSGFVETRIDGGLLFTAAVPPLAARGAVVSIRRARRSTARLAELVGDGMMSQGMADFLELALKARRNVVVSGPAGSGRSTLLSALGRALAEWGERIVSVEEAEELDFGEGAHMALVGRGAQARHAMQAAMRMRADRVVVGEIRGPEAFDMIATLSAGADGGLCAIQAASPRDAVMRMVQLARLASEAPSADALREAAGRGVHLIVQLTCTPDGGTRVAEIDDVNEGELSPVFTLKPDAAGGRFSPTGHVPAWAEGAPASTFRA
jgi:pilus assembly protein CpaF